MAKFEILCVTMHQTDFSKIQKMNIHSNVVFANQCDRTGYEEISFDGHIAKMISTQTRGVGINRNVSLMYASADICLLADDDMRYSDTCEEDILKEFEMHPDADVMIFNIGPVGGNRPQKQNRHTKKISRLSKMPYGAPRIALRLDALRRSNVWFTTLFGGGSKYSNGEDSIFLTQLRRAGLKIYVSSIYIGDVDMSDSTWFQGANEEFFFNKGAYLRAVHPVAAGLYELYFLLRVKSSLSVKQRWLWLRKGNRAYREGLSFKDCQ